MCKSEGLLCKREAFVFLALGAVIFEWLEANPDFVFVIYGYFDGDAVVG